jgi:imidazolonepropionase-like amidohydrolase
MAQIYILPCLLADPPPAAGTLILRNARLFDGTGGPVLENGTVVVENGRIVDAGAVDAAPSVGRVIDLEGRFLMPGIIDAHTHLSMDSGAQPAHGAEMLRPAVAGHLAAATLRRALRMGVTTIRDVGAYGDTVLELRQAMRYGAFRGPRLLTCARIVSATSPGGRHFEGMYREADGPDQMRQAAREQIRLGADFVKIMATGARSVELEDPRPAQVTPEEMNAVVDETHRLGYRLAAHCEGLAGTELAINAGADTIEHGFHLHQRPDLLESLAARRGVLVPTLSFLADIAGRRADDWSPHLVERGGHNLEEAYKTMEAALAAEVPLAMGFDSSPEEQAASELALMTDAGMSTHAALVAATANGAMALGLDDVIGTIEPGKFADLVVVDGDPTEDIGILTEPNRIHLVFQLGEPVAGAALDPKAP